ncbi:hypothetical protein HYW17_05560 [Candidatus Uhrbacteria bacterium]|nr:hypothetical protein [Candidatus Uhrbacteria bacterium]
MPERPGFLHKKYRDLAKSAEVQDIIDFTRPGEPIPPTKPDERIQAYLDFLKNLVERPDEQERERGIDGIKQSLYARHVIKPAEIPEAYFQSIIARHREEGYGDIEIPQDQRKELIEPVIEDQKRSLDQWVDYLASSDAKYPDYLKYWAFRSVLKMGRYDKEKKKFTERYGGTVSPFPELNQQALSLVFDAMEKKFAGQSPEFGYDISAETKQKFLDLLNKENFAKLYGLTIEEFKPISEELLKQTKGRWVKYPKGSDPKALVDSLAPYGTGWCIRGESTARRYLQGEREQGGNDLEVYYSNDKDGNPAVPRLVLVSQGDRILEFRGVGKNEEHDRYIGEVAQAKLAALPDGKSYEKKAQDMKMLTALERKVQAKQALTKDDLIFLYEINAPIENFGYNPKDPRIAELRSKRNPKEDAPIILDCAPDQIAWSKEEVNANTKAYVGPLFPNIFKTYSHLEHIYTSFPAERIRREQIVIGGRTVKQIEAEFKQAGMQINPYAKAMMEHPDFTTLKKAEQADLVRLTVKDLGFSQGATTQEIYDKAQALGLELCPTEVGPHYRLSYTDQPMREWVVIGMKQITDPNGYPSVFDVARNEDGLWLRRNWAKPESRWYPVNRFVFRLRPSTKA